MSWVDFTSVVGWHAAATAPAESLIVVTDTKFTSSDSLLLDRLALAVARGQRVILVHAAHSAQHWTQVAKKRSLNLSSLAHSHQLILVDDFTADTSTDDTTLTHRYRSIVSLINNEAQYSGVSVIFDSIETLTLQSSVTAVLALLSSLHSVISQRGDRSSLCVNLYGDVTHPHHSRTALLSSILNDRASLAVRLSPLVTGTSREFAGELSYVRRSDSDGTVSESGARHYRVTQDGRIQILNRG